MDGVINIFKPKGMTSHDIVSALRKILNTKRVGHTGTLDPNATGVLPICIGKGTRVAEYLLDVDKEYIGELTLGIRTDTQDSEGQVLAYSSLSVNEDKIINTMEKYVGDIQQLPPMYSALKHKGRKLYELAREGITVERSPRDVTIYNLKIMNIEENNKILFRTKCSRGTYIRTLCDDIGMELGTYGYMSYLIRVAVGSFKIDSAYSIDYLKTLSKEDINKIIVPMEAAINHMQKFYVEDDLYFKLINGVMLKIDMNDNIELGKPLRVYCKNAFIGVGNIIERDSCLYLKMNKVLI